MNLHVAIAGWLLGAHSGANTRLLALLRAVAPMLAPKERITVLHRPDFVPQQVHQQVQWSPIAIPAGPTWRRIATERRLLAPMLQHIGATLLDHGFLPVPEVACPVVLTIHDLRDADGQGRRPSTLARWLLRRSVARTQAVLVPSEFTAARLRALAPHPRIVVARNGVDLPPLGSAVHDDGYLLHVGHLEVRKNLSVLLHALALLPANARPMLHLVGADGGEGRRLRELAAQLGVTDRVSFLGQLSDAAVQAQYVAARAVVVPSRYEGFGLAALDALAHGKPTLVSDQGALAEVVGVHGTVLPAHDAAAWASAIQHLPTPDERATRARRAQASGFAWDASAAVVLATWRAAVEQTKDR